ncbi:hypothetical protein MHYP_G00131130 [Metynnis hypsauchen]
MPRELTIAIVTAVYIPPDAKALSLLLNTINEQQRAHPDGVHVIAGDFNKANLKTVLPKFHQHVKCSTRGENTLDHFYTNIKHAYRAIALPHLGQSDHLSLLLSPVYTPLRRRARPTMKTVTTWPDNALSKLQDCFEQTDWDLFEHQELETFTVTVLDYIKFCTGNVTVDKNIRVYPNQKPWMTSQVRSLLRARDAAFRSGYRAMYSAARADLKRGIKKAKADYKRRIESHMSSNNSREVWQSIQDITNFRGCDVTAGVLSAPLAEELNCFFARFDTSQQHSSAPARPPHHSAYCTGVRFVVSRLAMVEQEKLSHVKMEQLKLVQKLRQVKVERMGLVKKLRQVKVEQSKVVQKGRQVTTNQPRVVQKVRQVMEQLRVPQKVRQAKVDQPKLEKQGREVHSVI